MITLHACAACGHTVFPARQLCHRCGGASWTAVPCDRGIVAAATSVLAEVHTPQAVRVIVRCQNKTWPGASLALHEAEDGVLWGRSDADEA